MYLQSIHLTRLLTRLITLKSLQSEWRITEFFSAECGASLKPCRVGTAELHVYPYIIPGPTTIAPTIFLKWSMMKSSWLQYVHLNPHCALSSHCLTALCVVKAAVLQQQPAQLAQLSWPSAGSREVAPSCSAPVTRLTLTRVRSRAANVCFTISWLKAPNSTFTFKTLLRHYANQASTHGS